MPPFPNTLERHYSFRIKNPDMIIYLWSTSTKEAQKKFHEIYHREFSELKLVPISKSPIIRKTMPFGRVA